jgi:hypothetical protein
MRRLPDAFVGPRVLDLLASAAADAFRIPAPRLRDVPRAERLTAFALFTAGEAGRAAADAAPALYGRARALGSKARRQLGVRSPQEALEALTLLYRHIGIEMTGRLGDASDTPGAATGAPGHAVARLEVTSCFFSDHYCGPVCRVMGAMDAGVVDGLFGGASLEFSQRITEGSPCCRAIVKAVEAHA